MLAWKTHKDSNNKNNIGAYQRTEKTMDHEGDSDTNCCWGAWKPPQKLEKEIEGTGNQGG